MKPATQEKQVEPIAIPGIHGRFYDYFKKFYGERKGVKVLEVGAGHGAFTQKLWDDGYAVEACDLYPEIFYFKEIECRKADLAEKLPYPSDSFDAILAVEVMEHIHDHELFFKECHRLLKNGGRVMVSTPNILSLKSRVRFLFSGFFYSFKPLDHQNNDGLQHLASLTLDQYRSLGIRNGFGDMQVAVDKWQNSSRWLLFLQPFIWLYCHWKKIDYRVHNQRDMLLGRVLFLCFNN